MPSEAAYLMELVTADPKLSDTLMPEQTLFDESDPLGLVNFASRDGLLADLSARMKHRQGFTVATLNLDHIVKIRQNHAFAAAYLAHSHVVADGNPIVWLSRVAGRHVDLIPGSELILPLVALAAAQGVPIAMLGSTQDTLDLTAQRLKEKHPDLRIVASIAPAYGFDPNGADAEAALAEINTSGAGLCFLALGAPKQELLAVRGAKLAPTCGFVSIGAGLDFIAGSQARAPVWVRKIAMEWAWRMLSNPRRLAKRYAICAAIMPGLWFNARRTAKRNAN